MEKKFKFKSLQIYSSDEWMANSTKRYRTVFDRIEVSYLRVELAFYNKLFDEQDWKCQVVMKAFKLNEGKEKELCTLETEILVQKEENIVYVRDGWGNPAAGTYWYAGEYFWEAYVDHELVGTRQFYVNDIGLVTRDKNPYFDIHYIKLYCGNYEGWKQTEKKYLQKINSKTTQYLWCEMKIGLKPEIPWHYELFFNYFDGAGQPKAQTSRVNRMESSIDKNEFIFDVGWGNSNPGSWKDDKYTLEIVFMDTLVGAVSFECGEEELMGVPELLLSHDKVISASRNSRGKTVYHPEQTDNLSIDELLSELDQLIGLEQIKENIRENIIYLNFARFRKEKGFRESSALNLHSIFTGNPGTGKTTVVKMLGKIYHRMGLLSKGHVIEADRATLVAEYIGQTAPKTKKAIESARGGVLFIDEAYALAREDDEKDFGKEVVEVLLKEMSDGKGDIAIIGAGYPKKMQIFLDSNPGLKSRFNHFFHFHDYLPEELYLIALHAAHQKEIVMTQQADEFLKEQLTEAYRRRDESFGNARFVSGVMEEIKHNMGIRLMSNQDVARLSKEQLQTVELEDLQGVFSGRKEKRLKLSIHEQLLNECLTELNSLVGLEKIKQDLNELVKLIRYYHEIGRDVINRFSLHVVFTGNPGTGKTTVARIVAGIYKALGLLERGHLVEVDRQGLVANYVGQTAQKTQEKIEQAMGGVLFIDEAYSLNGIGGMDYGKEAIEILLKRMEDFRGKFGVIAAGYSENMQHLLESNPGFKSRFDKTFVFPDYNPQELQEIFLLLLQKEGLTATGDVLEVLKNIFNDLYERRDKFFGNARTIRQMVMDATRNQHLRMAEVPIEQRTTEDISTLSVSDIMNLISIEKWNARKPLGFRYETV